MKIFPRGLKNVTEGKYFSIYGPTKTVNDFFFSRRAKCIPSALRIKNTNSDVITKNPLSDQIRKSTE